MADLGIKTEADELKMLFLWIQTEAGVLDN